MKKIILTTVVGFLLIGCDTKPDKSDEVVRKETLQACENAAIQPSMSDDHKKALKSYCSCSTDKMVGEFSYVEMMQMNNPSPELKDKLQKLIAPCIKELEIKIEELEK